jgi:hypothetical protein
MPKPQFVVYHIASTMERHRYKVEHAARKLVAGLGPEYAYTTLEDYNKNVVYMVTRINLMSGLPFEEPSNTPGYMSPASESYWSM